MKRLTALSLSLVVTFLPLAAARAHVTLERPEAAVGGGYKAIFRVPHGCSESPTVKVRVRIPEGVIGVKPMPKAGWQLETVKAKYDKPYQMYHSTLTEGVREVTWTGKLLDENYDEFVLSTYSGRRPEARHDFVFSGRAGMRDRRASLD